MYPISGNGVVPRSNQVVENVSQTSIGSNSEMMLNNCKHIWTGNIVESSMQGPIMTNPSLVRQLFWAHRLLLGFMACPRFCEGYFSARLDRTQRRGLEASQTEDRPRMHHESSCGSWEASGSVAESRLHLVADLRLFAVFCLNLPR